MACQTYSKYAFPFSFVSIANQQGLTSQPNI